MNDVFFTNARIFDGSGELPLPRSGWPVRDDASQYELDGYLRVFEAMHPGSQASRMP